MNKINKKRDSQDYYKSWSGFWKYARWSPNKSYDKQIILNSIQKERGKAQATIRHIYDSYDDRKTLYK